MKIISNSSSARCLVLLVALAGFSQAQTVAWGTSASFNPVAFQPDGAVDNQVNLWTLGYFTSGFTPDTTNFLQWAANWNPVSSPVPEDDPLSSDPNAPLINDPTHKLYDGGLWATSVNTYDVGVAAGGRQVYIFAYNDLDLIGTDGGQALLYREDGLLFPTIPNQITFDIANNPLDTNDDGFTVIWGAVDRDMENVGGVLVGGGILNLGTDSAAPQLFGTFEAQFAGWSAIPIPEPSMAFLTCVGALALMRRKRNAS
jgi:hypothetical protein